MPAYRKVFNKKEELTLRVKTIRHSLKKKAKKQVL
jgi:hypothetical protein